MTETIDALQRSEFSQPVAKLKHFQGQVASPEQLQKQLLELSELSMQVVLAACDCTRLVLANIVYRSERERACCWAHKGCRDKLRLLVCIDRLITIHAILMTLNIQIPSESLV